MKISFFLGLASVALALNAGETVFGAETAATAAASQPSSSDVGGVSNTALESKSRAALLDKFYLNYFAIYHGAPVKDPGSDYTLNNKGLVNTKMRANLDSEATLAYLATPDVGVGPVVPFLIIPGPGKHFVLGDAGMKVFDRKVVRSIEGFNLYANLIFQLPTSDSSQARKMDYAIKTTPNVRYLFPRSSFMVGAWTEAKAYVGVVKDKTVKLYAAPYVNYALTDGFSLNLEYEMEAHHDVHHSGWDFTNYQTDLQPGFVWRITPHVLVNPYLQVFIGAKVAAETTALGAVFSATLL